MTRTLNTSTAAAALSRTASKPGGGLISHNAPQAVLGTAALTGLLVSVLSGTTTTTPIAPKANVRWMSFVVGGTGAVLDDSGRITIAVPEPTEIAADAVAANTASAAQLVHWLHERSGLTWDQLGKMFGVSRRAVHLWANGGRMNSTNLARLNEIVALVRELPARTPEQARTRLMAAGPDGRSIVDRFRARAHDDHVNAPALTPEQLLDALPGNGNARQ